MDEELGPSTVHRAPAGIEAAMREAGGRVTMARFIELALTHPDEGYYTRSDRVLGPRGDFSTAPSLSPAFNRALSRLVTELLHDALLAEVAAKRDGSEVGRDLPRAVVELGGGDGHLASAILSDWGANRPELRARIPYCIVEVNEGLRSRQARALREHREQGWEVRWGRSLEDACRGVNPVVIVSNEFFDALPVHIVNVSGPDAREVWVVCEDGLREELGSLSQESENGLLEVFGTVDAAALRVLTGDGIIELRPAARSVVDAIERLMPLGSLVTVDYGEWYSGVGLGCACGSALSSGPCVQPEAGSRGRTLRGYFRHQRTSDPLLRVGRQDLTADVDFAALDLHGRRAGFETMVFTTLAGFLAGADAGREMNALSQIALSGNADPLEADRQQVVLESLLDEEGLGGAFKVMVQVREEVPV